MAKKSVPAAKKTEISTANYIKFITSLKTKIHSAQVKGAIAVNKELIKLYWEMGKDIVQKQKQEGWGSKVLEKVAKDLQKEFPGVDGFSRSNIFYIRSFYVAYAKVQQVVGQFEALPIFSIPWGHNCKTKDNVFVEYVLRNFNRPIGVAGFEVKLVEKLPKKLKASLPTVEEIEAELNVIQETRKK